MSVCLVLQLDLSGNRLCGLYYDDDDGLCGTYTSDGIMALSKALEVTGSLTKINLNDNKLGQEGWCAIFDALCDSPQSKISKWDLSRQGINPTIAKSLAAYMAVSGALTSVRAPQ